jgi:hypothetical protein
MLYYVNKYNLQTKTGGNLGILVFSKPSKELPKKKIPQIHLQDFAFTIFTFYGEMMPLELRNNQIKGLWAE